MGNKSSSGPASPSASGARPQSPQLGRRGSLRTHQNNAIDLRFCICGAPGTGKTTLVDRLTGRHFNPAYSPTPETRCVMQKLSFKLADEMHVAIYDCADDAAARKALAGDIEAGGPSSSSPSSLGGCDVVAFLIDPRSKASLTYVKNELPAVPPDSDILIMINFKDLVTKDPSLYAITPENLRELAGASDGRRLTTFEVCLKDCYGLKTLQTIMNRPFIASQMKQLRSQLEELEVQLEGTQQEIQTYISSTNYDTYLRWLNAMQVPSGNDPKHGRASSGMAAAGAGQNQQHSPGVARRHSPPALRPRLENIHQNSQDMCDDTHWKLSGVVR